MTRTRLFACALAILLAGCGTTTPVPEDRFFQLAVGMPDSVLAGPALNGGLTVERVISDPMRSGRAILYRDALKPLELRRYHYEFWVDEPPEMLRRALVRYLGLSGVADVVQDGSLRSSTDYSLQARLQRFEQLVGTPSPGFEVEVEVTLYSHRSESILLSKVYRQLREAPEGDMHRVAEAMQSALATIFHSVAADIQSAGARL